MYVNSSTTWYWMDEEGFKKTCIKEKKKRGGIHQPVFGTWVADFMLRQDAGRFILEDPKGFSVIHPSTQLSGEERGT